MAILEVGPVRAFFMLDLSTNHLPLQTVEQINRGEFYRDVYLQGKYSFLFYIPSRDQGGNIQAELSKCPCPGFRAALKLAWNWNLKFIMYDSDAEIQYEIPELPIYDWDTT